MSKDYTNMELPTGWRWVPLNEVIASLETGSRPIGGAVGITEGIPSISAEHMNSYGQFDFSSIRFVPKDFYHIMTSGRIAKNDILIVKDGATTGKVCLVKTDFPFEYAVINEHVFLCRPDQSRISPEFLFYWLWGPKGQNDIRSCYQGSAIGGINQGFASLVKIPVPPLTEQKNISRILCGQMELIDSARKASQVKLEAIKSLPNAILRQVFPPPDQHLPKGWRWGRLGDNATLLPSKSIASDGDAEIKAVTTACITEHGFNPEGIKTARMWGRDVQSCILTAGEILVARSNTPELVGRACLYNGIPENIVASDLTIRIKTTDNLLPEFLSGYLSALYIRGYWRDHAGGASGTMKKITRTQVVDLSVPIASLNEQINLSRLLREKMIAAVSARTAAVEELISINSLPAALLRRAFNGEL